MTIKKTIPALALALIIAATSGLALAKANKAGQPGDNQAPPAISQMSSEDQTALAALWKAHQEKAAPLRDQMWAKRMAYQALMANPNTKPGDIQPVIDDMLRIKTQLRTEREAFFNQLEAKGYSVEQLRSHFWPDGHGRHWRGDWRGGPCGRDWDDDGHGYGPHRGGMMNDMSGMMDGYQGRGLNYNQRG